jgi:hypothetical protein
MNLINNENNKNFKKSFVKFIKVLKSNIRYVVVMIPLGYDNKFMRMDINDMNYLVELINNQDDIELHSIQFKSQHSNAWDIINLRLRTNNIYSYYTYTQKRNTNLFFY